MNNDIERIREWVEENTKSCHNDSSLFTTERYVKKDDLLTLLDGLGEQSEKDATHIRGDVLFKIKNTCEYWDGEKWCATTTQNYRDAKWLMPISESTAPSLKESKQ